MEPAGCGGLMNDARATLVANREVLARCQPTVPMIVQDINYAKGWRVVRKDDEGCYVRFFQGKWYSKQLAPWLGRKIWVDSYGWDAVQCWVVRFNMFICQIEDR